VPGGAGGGAVALQPPAGASGMMSAAGQKGKPRCFAHFSARRAAPTAVATAGGSSARRAASSTARSTPAEAR
jgi:hypothetical protein